MVPPVNAGAAGLDVIGLVFVAGGLLGADFARRNVAGLGPRSVDRFRGALLARFGDLSSSLGLDWAEPAVMGSAGEEPAGLHLVEENTAAAPAERLGKLSSVQARVAQ